MLLLFFTNTRHLYCLTVRNKLISIIPQKQNFQSCDFFILHHTDDARRERARKNEALFFTQSDLLLTTRHNPVSLSPCR